MSDLFGFKNNKDLEKHADIDGYSSFNQMGSEWHEEPEGGFSLKRLITNKRVSFIFMVFALGILLLIGKLFYLQILNGDKYESIAEENRIRIQEIKPNRGLIFDKNGEQLVENLPDFYLSVVAAELPGEEEFIAILEKIEQIFSIETSRKIAKIYKEGMIYHKVKVVEEHVDIDKVVLFKIQCSDCPGIYIKDRSKRHYLSNNIFSHSLGYLGLVSQKDLDQYGNKYSFDDYLGKSGLEIYYENYLQGEKGHRKVEVDSRGKEHQVINSQLAETGDSLKLTLDFELQKKMYETVEAKLATLETNRAVAIAMNPQNGEILGMVSYPGYDNNLYVQGISSEDYKELIEDPDKPMFFRAISGEYPPGSTIKPLMALAALEEGIITEWTQFNSVGGLEIGKWYFPDWMAGGHGITNVKKAIADSVNTFFYYIGGGYEEFEGLGVAKITNYLRDFGLGKISGIDLYGERAGFLPSKSWKEEVKGERWYVGDTYHLSIGQGDILVTPLQVANFTATIANGGTIYEPRLVE